MPDGIVTNQSSSDFRNSLIFVALTPHRCSVVKVIYKIGRIKSAVAGLLACYGSAAMLDLTFNVSPKPSFATANG